MRILFTLFISFCIGAFSADGQCGNLIIGGVIDGPLAGGTPKGIQVCATGSIADLSIYGLGTANNGGGSDGQEYTFPAEAAMPGDCFWVGSSTTGWMDFFGFTPCYTSGVAGINGDDPIELFCNGSVEDEFGDVALDGTGTCWDHLDGWAVNNSSGPNFGAFDCADWTFSGTNALDGETTNATADTPYPNTTQTCPLAAMPVELYAFEVQKARSNAAAISWTTAVEENSAHFEILTSNDGRNFQVAAVIEAQGFSYEMAYYEFMHENLNRGMHYYQLKQVDLDGSFTLFDIKSINVDLGSIAIFPTQVTSRLTVVGATEGATFEIFNSMGQLILNGILLENEIDLSALASGSYFFRVGDETLPFVK